METHQFYPSLLVFEGGGTRGLLPIPVGHHRWGCGDPDSFSPLSLSLKAAVAGRRGSPSIPSVAQLMPDEPRGTKIRGIAASRRAFDVASCAPKPLIDCEVGGSERAMNVSRDTARSPFCFYKSTRGGWSGGGGGGCTEVERRGSEG